MIPITESQASNLLDALSYILTDLSHSKKDLPAAPAPAEEVPDTVIFPFNHHSEEESEHDTSSSGASSSDDFESCEDTDPSDSEDTNRNSEEDSRDDTDSSEEFVPNISLAPPPVPVRRSTRVRKSRDFGPFVTARHIDELCGHNIFLSGEQCGKQLTQKLTIHFLSCITIKVHVCK